MAVFLDALPYLDLDYDDERMRRYVDSLVEKEMKTFKNEHIYEPITLHFKNSPILISEYERIAEVREIPKPVNSLDTNTLEFCIAQLEQERIRFANLELLSKYGKSSLEAENLQLQGLIRQAFKRLESCNAEIEQVNKHRKIEQMKAGSVLQALDFRISQSLQNISALENEIAAKRK